MEWSALAGRDVEPLAATHSLALMALPQHLLQVILVQGTSTKDKKALRQTCKFFQQMLDNAFVCIRLILQDHNRPQVECLLRRMQCVQKLKTVSLSAHFGAETLYRCLPLQLTTVYILARRINVKELNRLPCLLSLRATDPCKDPIVGIEHIHGLTRLHSWGPIGSLAHLAPTLRHLSIMDYRHVQRGLEMLTNLEVLQLRHGMPADFFLTHGHLHLKHISVNPVKCPTFFRNTIAWESAPTTLTSLTLSTSGNWNPDTLPDALAVSITHLQLLGMKDEYIEQASQILPDLRHLDFVRTAGYWDSALSGLSKLSSLQRLDICVEYVSLGYDQLLPKLPGVAKAVAKGVRLDVFKSLGDLLGELNFPCPDTSAWATHA